jgi:hypothetical protein
MPETPEELVNWLVRAMNRVSSGKLGGDTARALGTLGRAALSAMKYRDERSQVEVTAEADEAADNADLDLEARQVLEGSGNGKAARA